MGLDIHVMRPKRFFQRDFVLPVQQLLPDLPIRTIGATPVSAADAELLENQLIKQLRLGQLDQETHRYVLPATDDHPFAERFSYDQFDLLREFAAFLDYPVKQYFLWGARAFGDGYDLNDLPSLKTAWRRQRATYPHLVFHEDTRGFYFPTKISMPVKTEFGYIGSTSSLRDELTTLSAKATKALRHREMVLGAIALLLNAANASEQSKLPIVFDG
ncbi:MAG TPA: hypothetical protein VGM23_06230 [Armatimonadota bacterium]|jgi:hypothetical protein